MPWIIGGLAAVGGGLGGFFAGEGQQKAAAQQAEVLREINQWGYGYPDWLKTSLQQGVQGQEEYAKALRDITGTTVEDLLGYREQLSDIMPTAPRYRDIAATAFSEALRGAGEIGGAPAGMVEARRRELTPQLAQALAEAEIRGEQDRATRLFDLAGMTEKIGALGMGTEQEINRAYQEALRTATGIPSYTYTPPWPGVGGGYGAVLGATQGLGDAAQILGMMYGAQGGGTVNVNYNYPGGGYPEALTSYPDWATPKQ